MFVSGKIIVRVYYIHIYDVQVYVCTRRIKEDAPKKVFLFSLRREVSNTRRPSVKIQQCRQNIIPSTIRAQST